jgi:hypothetical protein
LLVTIVFKHDHHEQARLVEDVQMIRKILVRTTEFLLLLALGNFIWEFLGYFDKYPLFLILLVFYVGYRVFDYLHLKGWRSASRGIATFYFIAAIFFFLTSVSRAIAFEIRRRNPTEKFLYRVEAMQDKQFKLYESTYMPEYWYGLLKHVLGRAWYPQLRDYYHRFDSINISLVHLNHSGIYSWDYFCEPYRARSDGDDSLWYFLCQGEGSPENGSYRMGISVPPAGICSSCSTKPIRILESHKSYTLVCNTRLPYNCERFTRWFCSKGTMADTLEGFLLDFQYLEHPPVKIKLELVTNQAISEVKLQRLIRNAQYTLVDWVKASPRYVFDSTSVDLNPVSDDTTRTVWKNVILGAIEHYRAWTNDSSFSTEEATKWSINVFDAEAFLNGKANLYVVNYKVDKEKCPACRFARRKS